MRSIAKDSGYISGAFHRKLLRILKIQMPADVY